MRDLEARGAAGPRARGAARRRGDRRAPRSAGLGLTQPELAVLLAYAKITLYASLLDSDLPEDPALARRAGALLPGAAARALRRRDARATACAARSSRRGSPTTSSTARGSTFMFRLREDTGATHADIARALAGRARGVRACATLWARGRGARRRRSPRTSRRDAARRRGGWSSARRAGCCAPAAAAGHRGRGGGASATGARTVAGHAARRAASRPSGRRWRSAWPRSTDAGVPEALAGARGRAGRAVLARSTSSRSAGATGAPIGARCAALHCVLGGGCHLHWLRDQIALLAAATTAGRRWRARRCATTCTRAPHADRRVLREGEGDDPGSWSTRGWTRAARRSPACASASPRSRQAGARDPAAQAVAVREVAPSRLPSAPVGHDPDVDVRGRGGRGASAAARQAPEAAARAACADQHVGRAALAGDPRRDAATSSPSSTISCAPSTAASRRSASSCARSSADARPPGAARRGCRARACSRWAERHARRTTRSERGCELRQRQQPLGERLGLDGAEQPLLAQRQRVARRGAWPRPPRPPGAAPPRAAPAGSRCGRSSPAPSGPAGRVDRPSRRRVISASGVRSTSTTSSASASTGRGTSRARARPSARRPGR